MNKSKLSVLFMGTPEFACPSLDKLNQSEQVVAVVTQPDKPAGRGKRLVAPPVKEAASTRGIPVHQPYSISDPDFLNKVKCLAPDLIVVVAFGKLLPGALINAPEIFPLNVHPSLLPEFRGPAPIPWTLIKGQSQTGITIQRMREKIDTGEIILQKRIPVDSEDTCGSLTKKLSHLGAETLLEAVDLIKKRQFHLIPQSGKPSYAPKISKKMGKINWEKPAKEIHNLVRALNPSPGAFTTFFRKGKFCPLKIWKTSVEEGEKLNSKKAIPGEVVEVKKGEGFVIKTGRGSLLVKQVQMPGKNKISAYDFVKGYRIHKGYVLGEE